MAETTATHARAPDGRVRRWHAFLPSAIVATGLAAYVNSFAGVFLFDDRLHILGRRRLETLWPPWEALSRRRPVVDYSLGLNYAVGGENVWGYHAVNLTIHILAALTLYGIIRRTLLRKGLRSRFGESGPWLALAAAMIWVAHPLQTQAVTYIVQRAESLMGLFYLLTLYCVIRGVDSAGPRRWYVGAVFFCALGLGSKAVMVTAPVLVLVYDWVFITKSVKAALRQRWGLYLGLAATWTVLWGTGVLRGVLSPGATRAHVGFGYKGATPVEYALTQFGVITKYLRLSFWPHPLCLDYFWPPARTPGEIIPPALLIVALLVVTVWALLRKPALGFVGAWFFVILAPTSSFVPIRDPLFEHRMYLSLAAVVVAVVFAVDYGLRRVSVRLSWEASFRRGLAAVLLIVVMGSLTYGGIRRNQVYHSEVRMWQDVLIKRPESPRAAENLGIARLGAGDMEKALVSLREAVRISPRSANVHNALGFALVAKGELEEAVASFREAIRLKPTFTRAYVNLGNALNDLGRPEEAIQQYELCLRVQPGYAEGRLALGNSLFVKGKTDEAIVHYRRILEEEPDHAKAWGNIGLALINTDQSAEAVKAFQKALDINPDYAMAHNGLGIALASQKKLSEAEAEFREALRLDPNLSEAHYNLGNALYLKSELGDERALDEAIAHYQAALALQPSNAQAHFDLGLALLKKGEVAGAIREFETVLRIRPDHARARAALEAIRAQRQNAAPD